MQPLSMLLTCCVIGLVSCGFRGPKWQLSCLFLSLLNRITAAVATNHFPTLGINKLSSNRFPSDVLAARHSVRRCTARTVNPGCSGKAGPKFFNYPPQRLAASPKASQAEMERSREALGSRLPNYCCLFVLFENQLQFYLVLCDVIISL